MPRETPDSTTHPEFSISVEYIFSVISAWLIPGAGHWLLGYRVRGAILGAAILGLFWIGESLAVPRPHGDLPQKPMAVSRQVSPIFFACQVGNGFSAILANTLWGEPRYKNQTNELDRSLPPMLNLAILFTAVSGLLNYLLVLHIMDPRTWIQARIDAAQGGGISGGEGGAR